MSETLLRETITRNGLKEQGHKILLDYKEWLLTEDEDSCCLCIYHRESKQKYHEAEWNPYGEGGKTLSKKCEECRVNIPKNILAFLLLKQSLD